MVLPALVTASLGMNALIAADKDIQPNGKGNSTLDHPQNGNGNDPDGQAGNGKSGGGMVYHGGPVILGTTNVYYIWYGNWSGNSATTILTDFAGSIGGSPYFDINTTYYNGSNVHVTNAVSYQSATSVSYPYGTSLTDANIQSVVSNAI